MAANSGRRPDKNWKYSGPKLGLSWLGIGNSLEDGGIPVTGEGDLQGPALGTDEVVNGALVDNEAALQPTALASTATLPPPPHKKMGFGDHVVNVLTKGQHGQGFQSYNNAVDRAAYEAQLRGIYGQQQAASAMERAKAVQAAMDAREAAAFANTQKEIELKEGARRRELMQMDSDAQAQEKLKAITKPGYLTEEEYRQYHMPAVVASSTAAIRKPELENLDIEATTANRLADVATKQAELPTKGFLQVQERGAAINPLTGQVIRHAPSLDFDPRKDGGLMGGVTSSFLGGGRVVPKVNAGMSLAPQPADVTTEQELAQPSAPSLAPAPGGPSIYPADGGQQDINPTALNEIMQGIDFMIKRFSNPNAPRRFAFPGQ